MMTYAIQTRSAGGTISLTDVTTYLSGVTSRQRLMTVPLRRFTVDFVFPDQQAISDAMHEFMLLRGRAGTFLFTDPLCWYVGGSVNPSTGDFAPGSEPYVFTYVTDPYQDQYQLSVAYASGGITQVLRPVRHPLPGVVVYADGVELTDAVVNTETGMVTIPEAFLPLPEGAALGWIGTFQLCCRLDIDQMDMEPSSDGFHATWSNVPIREVRDW